MSIKPEHFGYGTKDTFHKSRPFLGSSFWVDPFLPREIESKVVLSSAATEVSIHVVNFHFSSES